MEELTIRENEINLEGYELSEKIADKSIRHHVYAAMAAGLIPIPFADFAGVAGIQLNLLRKLAKEYNVSFSKDMVKNLIGALLGGAAPASAGPYLFSLLKAVPVVGLSVGMVSISLVSGASTYAIGKVFNRHFAEGGTFLTFDPREARAFYAEMFRDGQKVIAELNAEKQRKDS